MNVASRTPEGEPNQCPNCAAELNLAPARPPGDAPCPNCGSLLWFDESISDWRPLTRYAVEDGQPMVALQPGAFGQSGGRAPWVGGNVRIRRLGPYENLVGAVARIDRLRGRVVVSIVVNNRVEFIEFWLDEVQSLN